MKCPKCGAPVDRGCAVEDLCSACLLSLGLSREEASTKATSRPQRATEGAGARVGARARTLSPVDTGVVAPVWAMPAEMLRQAARRLRLAAMGLGLSLAVAIVLNNLVEAVGWYSFSNLAIKNVLLASVVAASTAMAWLAHSGRLTPLRLLRGPRSR